MNTPLKTITALFDRFDLELTMDDAAYCSHVGDVSENVLEVSREDYVVQQFNQINPSIIVEELRGYGAWDDEQLADDDDNQQRIIWLAACNILEATGK